MAITLPSPLHAPLKNSSLSYPKWFTVAKTGTLELCSFILQISAECLLCQNPLEGDRQAPPLGYESTGRIPETSWVYRRGREGPPEVLSELGEEKGVPAGEQARPWARPHMTEHVAEGMPDKGTKCHCAPTPGHGLPPSPEAGCWPQCWPEGKVLGLTPSIGEPPPPILSSCLLKRMFHLFLAFTQHF